MAGNEKTQPNPLGEAAQAFLGAAGRRVVSSVTDRMGSTTKRLTDYTNGGSGNGDGDGDGDGGGGILQAAAGGAVKGGLEKIKSKLTGGGKKLKVTNILESIDVGVPVTVAYNRWTRFTAFPSFMKKVESVEQEEPQKLKWRAQVFLSHRNWESTIVDQVPDQHIVWRSDGPKGYPDGSVTFHELAPNLTRILLVLEYHPSGFFEKTANLWRAQGRRARLEFKHFARHVMTQTLLNQEELEGWRGEIHNREVQEPQEEPEEPQERDEEVQEPQERDEQADEQARDDSRQTGPRQRPGRDDQDRRPRGREPERAERSSRPRARSEDRS